MTDSIRYVGVNDHDVDLFEGQYVVPNGMAYNSYVILDEKVAILDTVDHHKCAEFLDNLDAALAGRKPDYLIIHHIEPDHASSVQAPQDLPAPWAVLPGAGLLLRPHGEGGGRALPGQPRAALRLRPHGPLAGGHDEL